MFVASAPNTYLLSHTTSVSPWEERLSRPRSDGPDCTGDSIPGIYKWRPRRARSNWGPTKGAWESRYQLSGNSRAGAPKGAGRVGRSRRDSGSAAIPAPCGVSLSRESDTQTASYATSRAQRALGHAPDRPSSASWLDIGRRGHPPHPPGSPASLPT